MSSVVVFGVPVSAAGLVVANLRCEYLSNPLGIDAVQPRLSWIVASNQRGQRQTAYEILVASSEEQLERGRGDLWDSGKVVGGETVCAVYAGKPLVSQQRCYWKVKVWDKDGKESVWSAPALWSMGLLQQSEWKAEWIGYDKTRQIELSDAPFEGAKWIWHAADPVLSAPKCNRLFVSTFTIPDNTKIDKAELLVTAGNGGSFVINTQQVVRIRAGGGPWRQPRLVNVTSRIKVGANDIRVEVENAKEGPAGLLAKLIVTTADGKTFTHLTDGSWRSSQDFSSDWQTQSLDAGAWPAVGVLGDYGIAPWGKLKFAATILPPASFLRASFRVGKPVRRAMVYATGLGIFDVCLNGQRVSDDFFNPGWTDYDSLVRYRAYDVTARVRSGENVLGAILADGWYGGYVGFNHERDHYGTKPRVRIQLHLEYADGSTAVVATGPDWKAATGPIREADFLVGETYDARLMMDGWDEPGFDDRKWDTVNIGAELQPLIQAHPGPAVREIAHFEPKKITEPKPKVYVFDLGQNFAGVARLKVRGKPGQKITLRFAERLNPDGTIYTENLRAARATDTYICRGKGVEIWQPRFTFHGFRYVEITGLAHRPPQDALVGVALSSDTPVASAFTCSDPMLNKLHSNVYWTQRSNFVDIPTDCPQRDERLGWTGDAQVYIRTATLNTDVQAFFTKWLVDLDDYGQREDGEFPCFAPVKVDDRTDGGPAWADAGVICPWTVYEVYGDRRVLERHYDSMTKFIAFCKNRSKPDLLPPDKYHCFGDWLSINADTPKDIIYMAYFAYSTKLTARAAEALGKSEDAAKYNELFDQIKAAFNKAYVADDGRIKGDTQTCYVLALAFDLVDGGKAKLAAKHLVEDIESRGWHLSTGFIGTKDLMLVLAKIGRNDVAYRLIHNDTFPSWGFSIRNGATSIWERWDGWTPEKGFQTPTMNSFAHYSFGAVYQWMVENIGGIRTDGPAYKCIIIAPQFDGRLTSANMRYDSIRGRIETDWKLSGGRLTIKVTVPANTTATVLIPTKNAANVAESGKPLDKTEGVKFLRMEGDRAVLSVESGSYQFLVKDGQ
jgi:alpha-L-rhamnosidase